MSKLGVPGFQTPDDPNVYCDPDLLYVVDNSEIDSDQVNEDDLPEDEFDEGIFVFGPPEIRDRVISILHGDKTNKAEK